MELKYCTFWYPTIYHQDLNLLRDPGLQLEEDISDGGESYHLSLQLEVSGDIKIISTLGGSKPYTVLLKKFSCHKTGFVQYSFDIDLIDTVYREKFETVLCKDVYHLAKQFYHEHETNKGKDGALRAVLTDAPESLEKEDNVFLTTFLSYYHDIFQGYAKDLSYLNKTAQKREGLISYIQSKLRAFNKHRPSVEIDEILRGIRVKINEHQERLNGHLLDINRICESALIEYTYYRTLSDSKYNKSFHHDSTPHNAIQEVWREKAANIRNSVRYIENIKYINQNRFNRFSVYKLDEARRLQEESKSLQKKSSDLIHEVRHSESKNTVVAWFSVFLAIVFGLLPIVKSVVGYFLRKEKIDWVEVVFGGILVVGAIGYFGWYRTICKKGNDKICPVF